jgi:glucoamylase
MPLVWAHAEHVKLLRSIRDGAVFDMPPQTLNRYVNNKPAPAPVVWQVTSKVSRIAAGRLLRLEFLDAARIHWSMDNWKTISDSEAIATGLDTYVCDLPTDRLTAENIVRFAVFWPRQNRWEGADFQVEIVNAP